MPYSYVNAGSYWRSAVESPHTQLWTLLDVEYSGYAVYSRALGGGAICGSV